MVQNEGTGEPQDGGLRLRAAPEASKLSLMSTTTSTSWAYLDRRPGSPYRQLFLKGTNYAARFVYDWHREEGETAEEIAATFGLPVEAVREAIAYSASHLSEIAQDRELDEARIQARLQAMRLGQPWVYLDRKPGSSYRQLFVRGRGIRARTLYGMYMSETQPHTLEEIAAAYELPLDVVVEAMAYCASDPPEIREDWEEEEALMRSVDRNAPGYQYYFGPPEQPLQE
jgi:uncharacterized protein (DUF433 family)